MKNIHTDLKDDELIERCDSLIDDFTKGKMREWVMHIPAEPNKDPDLIFSELISRYKRLRDALEEANYWAKGEGNYATEEPYYSLEMVERTITEALKESKDE